jgi:predicted nucleic acid-binding protein
MSSTAIAAQTPARLLLDTNIVIELFKKNSSIVAQFLSLSAGGCQFMLSPIVVAEVYAGAFKREHKDIEAFFALCERTELDCSTGMQAGHYANALSKAYSGVAMEDFLLAATAQALKCPLWTLNRKHFPMKDLTLYEPS